MLLRSSTVCFIAAFYCFYMDKLYPDLRLTVSIHTCSLMSYVLMSIFGHIFGAMSLVLVEPCKSTYSISYALPCFYDVTSSTFAGYVALGTPEAFCALPQLPSRSMLLPAYVHRFI
ncbi:hypothetical protein EDD18DRAFT_1364794 [Armillaria luteobubalina]|uniref:Uncharacterized protein n=1 Tax=Armillaria luteobubalina TaxID=153913 RepID=A0AA39P5Y6_9AGAR|nr:hypothetical protein EDD18DRAFT_1364794 [Armillaria luteobubalina]